MVVAEKVQDETLRMVEEVWIGGGNPGCSGALGVLSGWHSGGGKGGWVQESSREVKIAVVIPMYKVRANVARVVARIGREVWRIYAVDDACPERSGDYLEEVCQDPRLRVIRHETNAGVGGAVVSGYIAALEDRADILVKLDGDGQMNPSLIPVLVRPILERVADYTKGNRFYYFNALRNMPRKRIFGNAVLSFFSKLSSGYWDIFDPTNGYTAISSAVARHIDLDKLERRWVFESDMLYHLNVVRAVVMDVPMEAIYGDEISNLKVGSVVWPFIRFHVRKTTIRVLLTYYIRDFSIASLELPLGVFMMMCGIVYGAYNWVVDSVLRVVTPTGTVMLSTVLLLLGAQLILAFLAYDIAAVPSKAISERLTS